MARTGARLLWHGGEAILSPGYVTRCAVRPEMDDKMRGSTNLDFLLWLLLHHSHSAVNKVSQKELVKYGITLPQLAVLREVLRSGEKATPAEIARQLFLESHSVSEQLRRMEEEGLIKKVRDLNRKNLVRIKVTEKGHRFLTRANDRKSIHYLMSVLSEEEKFELWLILAKLRGQAAKRLGMKAQLYPPSDPASLTNLESH
jgi:DNA-binding MarR family transcriptional regulator